MLDAPGLVEEDNKRHAAGASFEAWTAVKGGPVDFIQKMSAGKFILVDPKAPIDDPVNRANQLSVDRSFTHPFCKAR